MRLTIDPKGLKDVQAELRGFSDRRMAAAVATAITRTAVETREGVKAKMQSIFDRPTAYTLGGVASTTATAAKPEAEVFIKDRSTGGGRPASTFLAAQVRGGARKAKGFERLLQGKGLMPDGWRAVPGAGAKLDQYGNLDRTQLGQILSQLRVSSRVKGLGAGSKGIAAQRKAGGRFFAVLPGRKGARPGIYQREFAGKSITPVLIFVPSAVYSAQFPFAQIAAEIARQRIGPNVERAIRESAARLAARSR
ncbi:MAG: hypothetical protein JNN18_09485 [Rubrivivax sp.]|nr:hypothetical protein [Rubrivivax sp.]